MFPLTFWGVAKELWPHIRATVDAILRGKPDEAAVRARLAASRAADKIIADKFLERFEK